MMKKYSKLLGIRSHKANKPKKANSILTCRQLERREKYLLSVSTLQLEKKIQYLLSIFSIGPNTFSNKCYHKSEKECI